jgi:glycyl-tRNA synthetase
LDRVKNRNYFKIEKMKNLNQIVNLCKRRGFIFPGSEIYGGLGSFWDYGPLGVLLKNNVKAEWWKSNVQERADVVGLDAAILMNAKVWEASGHTANFYDVMVECKKCHERYRFDHYLEGKYGEVRQKTVGGKQKTVKRSQSRRQRSEKATIYLCPKDGGELTEPKKFNMMFKTFVGPVEDESSIAYLRPETAQGIFVNFKNVLNSSRKKLPFGIAQIGKAFRNEITPGNFTFRTREFEQMEIEYFCHPKEAGQRYAEWAERRHAWYISLGIKRVNLRHRKHEKAELAHYARQATDIEYNFPMGWSELEGIANRGDFDLLQHQKFSKADLTYFDEETGEKYLPYVIEPSGGVDRATLAFLVDAYAEYPGGRNNPSPQPSPTEGRGGDGRGQGEGESEIVLHLHPRLAPIKVAVLPLVRKAGLPEKAAMIFDELKTHFFVQYDEVGSIGRRYRRQDEIGTPWCVTVDFQTLGDDTVTVRDRDTMKQERVKVPELPALFQDKLK